jgi:hypothetical protein
MQQLLLALLVAAAAAATVAAAAAAAATDGVRLRVYDNSGLLGPPVEDRVLQSAAFSLPGAAHGGAWSAELSGQLLLADSAAGLFNFSCAFANTTLGFVWVDGHLICQDGNAYPQQGPGGSDNPLPINVFNNASRGAVSSLPFRAHVYYNKATLAQQSVVCGGTRSAGCYDDYPNNQCGFTKIGSNNQTWELAAALCHSAGFTVAGVESQQETWCSNSLTPDCPRLPQSFCNQTCGGNSSQTCGQGWTLEPIAFECSPAPAGTEPAAPTSVGLTVSWCGETPRTLSNSSL